MNSRAVFDVTAPSRSTNLRLNGDLVDKAKAVGLNLSRECEAHLAEVLKNRMEARWRAENQEAFRAYNGFVEQHGLFSDGLREY